MGREEPIDLRPIPRAAVEALVVIHHGYGALGKVITACYGVIEGGRVVAAFAWAPPAPQAARQLSAAPGGAGVLALSRMVAVPREERRLRHISKALKRQMTRLLDRGRWPVLVTWSDASLGHTGHVYRCSGWQKDGERTASFRVENGARVSRYSNGAVIPLGEGQERGTTVITRWVDRACPAGEELAWLEAHGWRRVPSTRVWKSGNQGFTWEKQA